MYISYNYFIIYFKD